MERLSLDLLEQKKLLQMTKKMQEDFFESSNIFQQELQKIVQESKNQRFTDILVKILGDYNQWVGGVLKDNILEAWKTSSEGLSAVAQKYHAGKEADATAKKITHLIEENSEVKKTFKPLDLPDTSHPILSEEYYERMENAVQKYVDSLGRKKDQIKRQLNRQKEENMAFACLIGICESIYTTAIAFWSRQKEEIEKEHEKYNHNMKKKQVEAANLADTMEKAAVLRAGANLASEKSLTNGGSKSAESCDEVGGETSDDSVGQDASKEDQAVKEPYLSCLRKFMERFQKEPGNVKVFHDLATYMLEIARDLNKEDSYYTDEETADILRKLMIIAESYVMFGNREFDILSGEDSWKKCVDYQCFPTFINRYEDYFQENDYEDYTQGMYKPEFYDRVARQIQNMCKLSCEPSDIEEITELYVEILNKELALSQEKKKEYPNFSRLASRQIQKILNGEEVQAENVSVYGELVDVAMKLSEFEAFRELTEKIYNIVCNDMCNSVLRITPEMIIQIMPIYEEFYQDFGTVLKVETAPKSLNAFGEEELVKVTEDRGNVKFFDEGEWNDYQVAARQGMAQKYDCAARMEKNIANAYASGKANTMNLIYGMYVALIPIMKGRLRINDDSFSKFCSKATDRLLEILGRTDIINNNKSIKHINNIEGRMQQEFASMNSNCSEALQNNQSYISNISNNEIQVERKYGRYVLGSEEIQEMKNLFRKINSFMAQYEEIEQLSWKKNKEDTDSKLKLNTKICETYFPRIVKKAFGEISKVMMPTPLSKQVGKQVGKQIGKQVGKYVMPIVSDHIMEKSQSKDYRTKEWVKNEKNIECYHKDIEAKIRAINSESEGQELINNCTSFGEELEDIVDVSVKEEIEEFYKERYINGIHRNWGFKSNESYLEVNSDILKNNPDLRFGTFFYIMSKHAGPTNTQIETSMFATMEYIKQHYMDANIEWCDHIKEYNGIFLNLFRAGLEIHAEELGWDNKFANEVVDELYYFIGKDNVDLSLRPIEVEKNIQKCLGNKFIE